MKITVIDYRLCNVRSVANALARVGAIPRIVADARDLGPSAEIDGLILPGVGAFGDAMNNLGESGWIDALSTLVRCEGKPLLGICLGMQLLFSKSYEFGEHRGLDFIPGTVTRLEAKDTTVRIPHVGWNDVVVKRSSRLFAGLNERETFYFVHSYACVPQDPEVVTGTCHYGAPFVAAIERENVFGTQFHPEKSQRVGFAVLRNFCDLVATRAQASISITP